MSIGAEGHDVSTNSLLKAITGTIYAVRGPVTYAFEEAGALTEKGGYSGGSTFTSAWSEAQKDGFRAVVQQFMNVSNLQITEVASTATAKIDLQMVEDVPGGWAGYAGGSTFVVGGVETGLLLHEFGHSMALGHTHDTSFNTSILPGVGGSGDSGSFGLNSKFYSIMSYNWDGYFGHSGQVYNFDSLGTLDIAALQVLYGANSSYRTGNDTYGLTEDHLTIWDAGGHDHFDFSAAIFDTVIDLRAATLEVAEGGGGRPSYVGSNPNDFGAYLIAYGVVIEDGTGGQANDLIVGNAAANRLSGNAGNDEIRGGGGRDVLDGGTGNDRMIGGNGNDLFMIGTGDDIIVGGEGRDTVSFADTMAAVRVELARPARNTGEADGDRFLSVENLIGTGQRDIMSGNGDDNWIAGGDGNDSIEGRAGDDILRGDAGSDRLLGEDGNDELIGGSGWDRLEGGAGDDLMQGGGGRDTFVFTGGADVITDFGQDRLFLDDALWSGNLTAAQVMDFASVLNGDTVFDFGGGNTLVLEDFTGLNRLEAALTLF